MLFVHKNVCSGINCCFIMSQYNYIWMVKTSVLIDIECFLKFFAAAVYMCTYSILIFIFLYIISLFYTLFSGYINCNATTIFCICIYVCLLFLLCVIRIFVFVLILFIECFIECISFCCIDANAKFFFFPCFPYITL